MKKIAMIASAFAIASAAFAQDKNAESIRSVVSQAEIEAHVTFLAADEMRGRDTGSPEAAIAANYLAANFATSGLKKVPGMTSYFQQVGLQQRQAVKIGDLKIGESDFKVSTDFVVVQGKTFKFNGDFVFIGYGTEADFKGADIKGKIVVTNAGGEGVTEPRAAFGLSMAKYKMATEKGAAALIEVTEFPEAMWGRIVGRFSRGGIGLAEADNSPAAPQIWLRKSAAPAFANLVAQKKATGSLSLEKAEGKPVPGLNVIGLIEGTDAKLKEEYIVLSAHYDHIGVQKNGTNDSIYNGARDNALGTTAIIEAAKYIALHPVKRSILVIAYTGEEKGLLGSKWYAEHPVVPLNKTVYNLDCDGAGYNDKTIITLIDLNRTSVDDLLKKGVAAFGLTLSGDPVPSENLYERSDNYSFAAKGVPAVDFAPGIKTFDDELNKYYHQAADEASSLDYDYVAKYVRSYIYASWLVGNATARPTWKAGDKFEPEGKKLYGGK